MTTVDTTPTLDLADHLAIRQLVERYFLAVDAADGAAVAGMFTEDGLLGFTRSNPSSGPTGERRGRAAIEEQTNWLGGVYRETGHICASQVLYPGDDPVRGRVRCVAHHIKDDDGPATTRTVFLEYDDVYVKEDDGQWRFASRNLIIGCTVTHPVEVVG
ncbi:MAG TPA: nuclear transport factor 2 family protein [Acidimicrobiales bacterium]|nr:nuclear transport factor 2 family protein [Acidimicrobiales bacterium]